MQNFVILGPTRAGTSLLVNILNQHKKIVCKGEALKRYSKTVKGKDTLREWFDKFFYHKDKGVRGFKMLYEHFDRIQEKRLQLGKIFNDFSIKVIHITRKSLLKQFISFSLALTTKNWNGKPYANLEKGQKVKLPLYGYDSMNSKLLQWLREEREVKAFLKEYKTPHYALQYEDLCSDLDESLAHLLPFLGVKFKRIKPTTVKQFVWNYKDAIENYFELLEWMQRYHPERI